MKTDSTDIPTWKTSTSNRKRAAAVYAIAAVCLGWVLRDFHPTALLRDVLGMRWGWVAMAVVVDVAAYFAQGWRWELLLRPIGRIPVTRTSRAIFAGLFTNHVLPLRAGEFVRAYLVSRRMPARFSDVLPSMAVEHLFDGVWLFLSLAVAAIVVPMPSELRDGADILGIVLLAGIGVFFYFAFAKKNSRWGAIFRNIGCSRGSYGSFAVSGLFLALQALGYCMVIVAYGIHVSVWHGFIVFLIYHLGTALPGAPANVGTYQFFTVLGLTLFGVGAERATNFSLVAFLVLTLPLTLTGFLAMLASGTSLHSLRSQISAAMEEAG